MYLSLYYAFSLTKTYEEKLIQANTQLKEKSRELKEKNEESIKSTKFIEISVKDTGMGMRKEELEKLFKIESGFSI